RHWRLHGAFLPTRPRNLSMASSTLSSVTSTNNNHRKTSNLNLKATILSSTLPSKSTSEGPPCQFVFREVALIPDLPRLVSASKKRNQHTCVAKGSTQYRER